MIGSSAKKYIHKKLFLFSNEKRARIVFVIYHQHMGGKRNQQVTSLRSCDVAEFFAQKLPDLTTRRVLFRKAMTWPEKSALAGLLHTFGKFAGWILNP